MNFEIVKKQSFCVMGKEGSTNDGKGFIKQLWNEANSHFNEIELYALKDNNGKLVGLWGAMSDFTLSFQPWENNFSQGLYLAGVECEKNAIAPDGWSKWTIPGYEYFVVEASTNFLEVIAYLKDNNMSLVGATHDHTNPQTQKSYTYFPIKKL